jgi:CHAD domain-containing protein
MKELETKFVLRGGKPRKALRRLLQELVWAGFLAHPKGTRLIRDVYYDTADHRIKKAGWSLRARRKGSTRHLTCKQLATSSDGWFERREIEQPVAEDPCNLTTIAEGPVRELLCRFVPEQAELTDLFHQWTRRTTYLLTHPDHPRGDIELVMDRVRLNGQHRKMNYVEFEAELKLGTSKMLADFADVMLAQPNTIQARNSKYQRGLFNRDFELAIGDRKREFMTPADSWEKLGIHYLDEQLTALRDYAPYAYEGIHIEGVHQMRVATRRMRAALRAFGSVMPVEETRALIKEASWLCDVLGDVRDLDVQLEHAAGYRKRLPGRYQNSMDAYERHLQSDHRRAHRCLTAALDSRRYAEFLIDFTDLIRALEQSGGSSTSTTTVESFARSYVPSRLRSIRKAGRKIDETSPDKDLHSLRIRIKRLRYQLEILSGPYGSSLKKASRHLRSLQGRLGDHQDACVARTELANYRDTQARGRREKKTFDRLIKLEDLRAEALRVRFHRDWRRFESESRKLQKVF